MSHSCCRGTCDACWDGVLRCPGRLVVGAILAGLERCGFGCGEQEAHRGRPVGAPAADGYRGGFTIDRVSGYAVVISDHSEEAR
jgi:hypothetical protein